MIPSSVHLGGSPNPTARLPIVDLDAPDRASTIRETCVEYGFFYLVNHGVDQELVESVLEHSRKFFSLPLDRKNQLLRNHHRGYTPLFSENLDPSSSSKGDSKESFYIGPLEGDTLNQWPPPVVELICFCFGPRATTDLLPSWRITMEAYYEKLLCAGKKLVSVIALALNLDEDYFEKIGALVSPDGFLRLLHYPGDCTEEMIGASEHSDYGMITLLMTDGVPGLQVCKEKDKQPRVWEDVLHVKGAFIVNIGDMMERWTNCLFRSTLHRVMPVGQERYSDGILLGSEPRLHRRVSRNLLQYIMSQKVSACSERQLLERAVLAYIWIIRFHSLEAPRNHSPEL
ncbi:hypothetical protein OROHE_004870 [Orobanche hederae]